MARIVHALCNNCKWTWSGREDLFGRGNEVLLCALNREHYEGQPGPVNGEDCERPNIILSHIQTYYCLICNTTTPVPHVCPVFYEKNRPR